MKYCERIRELRIYANKTQTEVAELLKVGQRTYCDYELGKTRIPVDSLLILAELYNVSIDYISGVSNVRNPFPGK